MDFLCRKTVTGIQFTLKGDAALLHHVLRGREGYVELKVWKRAEVGWKLGRNKDAVPHIT